MNHQSRNWILRLQLVSFIKQYLQDSNKDDELIPSNIGLSDLSIESQISRYNETLLRRNRLVSGSSSNNPVVQELNRIMQTMKQNIYMAVDNLSKKLETEETRLYASGEPCASKKCKPFLGSKGKCYL